MMQRKKKLKNVQINMAQGKEKVAKRPGEHDAGKSKKLQNVQINMTQVKEKVANFQINMT